MLYCVLALRPPRKNCCLGRPPAPLVVIETCVLVFVRRDGFELKAQKELDRLEKTWSELLGTAYIWKGCSVEVEMFPVVTRAFVCEVSMTKRFSPAITF